MIYGKIWCVVKPTVGIPLFLGAVALTSLFVHYQLITHTSWLPAYYNNAPVVKTAAAPAADAPAVAAVAAAAAPVKK